MAGGVAVMGGEGGLTSVAWGSTKDVEVQPAAARETKRANKKKRVIMIQRVK